MAKITIASSHDFEECVGLWSFAFKLDGGDCEEEDLYRAACSVPERAGYAILVCLCRPN